MVEVQVAIDHDVNAGEVEVVLAQRLEARIHVGDQRVQRSQAGVHQHPSIGMVDDMHVDGHPLVPGEQVGDEDRRDGDRGEGVHPRTTAAVQVMQAVCHRPIVRALSLIG